MNRLHVHSFAMMGTVVTLRVRGHDASRIRRAVDWFRQVEAICSRFEPGSEVSRLAARPGVAVPASDILYRAVEFALAVAEESGGAFDPTVGRRMESRGFNREYRSGRVMHTPIDPDTPVSHRDVVLDPVARTITLLRPLLLDLGAVAKGMAVDLAARELEPLEHFTIDAGGDLYLGGRNEHDAPWTVGIRHPREPDALIDQLSVSNAAVCTSGDYDRRSPDGESHIMDPRTGESSTGLASVTVVAPSAMVADALATAAFVLGPEAGLAFLESQGIDGLLITPALEQLRTRAPAGVMPGH